MQCLLSYLYLFHIFKLLMKQTWRLNHFVFFSIDRVLFAKSVTYFYFSNAIHFHAFWRDWCHEIGSYWLWHIKKFFILNWYILIVTWATYLFWLHINKSRQIDPILACFGLFVCLVKQLSSWLLPTISKG